MISCIAPEASTELCDLDITSTHEIQAKTDSFHTEKSTPYGVILRLE